MRWDQDIELAGILERILVNLSQKLCSSPAPSSVQQVQYRRAQPSNWPEIEKLLQHASLPTEDAVDHLDWFTVGVGAADPVAVGGFESRGSDALLRSFVVAPQLRGRH